MAVREVKHFDYTAGRVFVNIGLIMLSHAGVDCERLGSGDVGWLVV
jgi:hypothetical protein